MVQSSAETGKIREGFPLLNRDKGRSVHEYGQEKRVSQNKKRRYSNVLEIQHSYIPASSTGLTFKPTEATNSICKLNEVNKIQEQLDTGGKSTVLSLIEDATGNSVCELRIGEDWVRLGEVSHILAVGVPTVCANVAFKANLSASGALEIRFDFPADNVATYTCKLVDGDGEEIDSKIIRRVELDLQVDGTKVVPADDDTYLVMSKEFECVYEGRNEKWISIDSSQNSRYTKIIEDGETDVSCEFSFPETGDDILEEFMFTVTRASIQFYNCLGGYRLDADLGECEPCPAGTYKTDNTTADCVPCEEDQYSLLGATECSLCERGVVDEDSHATCTICPIGQISKGNACVECAHGTFQNGGHCEDCPEFQYSKRGWGECYECQEGFQVNRAKNDCTVCPANTYKPSNGTECVNCEQGFSTNGLLGQSFCTRDEVEVLYCMEKAFNNAAVGDLLFPITQAGRTASAPCFYNQQNLATRMCLENGMWGSPDISECDSAHTVQIEQVEITSDSLDEVLNVTQSGNVGSKDVEILCDKMSDTETLNSLYQSETETTADITNKNMAIMSNLMTASTSSPTVQSVKNEVVDTTEIILTEALSYLGEESSIPFESELVDGVMVKNAAAAPVSLAGDTITFETSSELGALAAVVYRESNIFQTVGGGVVSGKVVGLSAPNWDTSLPMQFSLKFRKEPVSEDSDRTKIVTRECNFYNPNTDLWLTTGCTTKFDEDGNVKCECDHMTSFAVILSVSENMTVPWLSDLVLGITIFFSVLTLLATLPFRPFRVRKMTVIRSHAIVNLICLCICWYCMYIDFDGLPYQNTTCQVVAFLAHYFLMTYFSWICCCTLMVKTQIVDAVKSFGKKDKNLVKKCIWFSYGVPVLIPSLALLVDHLIQTSYSGSEYDNPLHYIRKDECWYEEIWLYSFILFPIYVFMALNIVFFVMIMRVLENSRRRDDANSQRKVLKAGFALAFTQGLPWLIHPGVLQGSFAPMIFQYLFLITFGLQGPGLFLFNVLLQEEVMKNLFSQVNMETPSLFLSVVPSKRSRGSENTTKKTNSSAATRVFSTEEKCYTNSLALSHLTSHGDDGTIDDGLIYKNLEPKKINRSKSEEIFKRSPIPGETEEHTGPPLL